MSTPQVRVLRCLAECPGWMSKPKLCQKLNNSSTLVGKTIGYSDPVNRAAFEQTKDGGGKPGKPFPSLLTLGYVEETVIDVEGVKETCYQCSANGRAALAELKE